METLNLQGQAILSGLKRLENILTGPFATAAFEIPSDAQVMESLRQVGRLRKSLEQYLQRTSNLTYVGFVGHYSAGKSSVINSLLNLSGTIHERKIGKHPTDVVITLLTHTSNSNDLLQVSGSGSIPIAIDLLENDFLKHIVVADTPGTGDPGVTEEIARDFLPVCDLVVFVLSAAMPLDRTDEPALRELYSKLRFIPLLFVVTRADELRRDKLAVLSLDNYNIEESAAFLAELLSRLSQLISTDHFSEGDFYLIDNITNFGVKAFKDQLLTRCDPHSPSTRINIHTHKIQFYSSSAIRHRSNYVDYLDRKSVALRGVVEQAEANIRHYDHSITVSNANLTRSWQDRNAQLNDLRLQAERQSPQPAPIGAHLKSSDRLTRVTESATEAFGRLVASSAETISQRAKERGFKEIQDHFATILKRLKDRTDLDYITGETADLTGMKISWSLDKKSIVSSGSLIDFAADYRLESRRCVEATLEKVRAALRTLADSIADSVVQGRCKEILVEAEREWTDDLEKYFDSVEIYRAGVFALGTGGLTSQIGIDRDELIKLHAQFTEEFKQSVAGKAHEAMFPQVGETLTEAKKEFERIAAAVSDAERSAAAIHLSAPPKLVEWIETTVDVNVAKVVDELEFELGHEASMICHRISDQLKEIFSTSVDSCYSELAEALKKRKRLYWSVFVAVTAAVLTATVAVIFGERPAGQSIGSVVLLGAIGSVLANVVALGFVRFRDNYPRRRKRILKFYIDQIASSSSRVADSILGGHVWRCLAPEALETRLKAIYNTVWRGMDTDSWHRVAEEQYDAVRTLSDTIGMLRRRYVSVSENLIRGCEVYFNVMRNLEKIRDISGDVKGRAIEPTFGLLENTARSFDELKRTLEQISFS